MAAANTAMTPTRRLLPVALALMVGACARPGTSGGDDDDSAPPSTDALLAWADVLDGYHHAYVVWAIEADITCEDITDYGVWDGTPGHWMQIDAYRPSSDPWEGEYGADYEEGPCAESDRCFEWYEREGGEIIAGSWEDTDDQLWFDAFGDDVVTGRTDLGDIVEGFEAVNCGERGPPWVD